MYVCTLAIRCLFLPTQISLPPLSAAHSVFPYLPPPLPPSLPDPPCLGNRPGLSGYIDADKLNQVHTYVGTFDLGVHWPRKQALQQADVVMPVR